MGLTRIRAQQITDIDYKQAVRAATDENITLAGGAPVVVDGVTLQANNRVLVRAQSDAAQNGIYFVSTLGSGSNGTWARTSDANQTGEIDPGMVVMVTEGVAYADTPWKLITNGEITIGVTELTFEQFATSGGPAFYAYANNTTQTIPTGVQTKVLFQVEEYDTNNCFANSKFTPTVEGYYQLNAAVRVEGTSGTGEMMIVIWKNGSEYKRGTNQSGTQIASDFWTMQVSGMVYANGTTDYFEIYVQQGSDNNRNLTTVNARNITWFDGALVRGA
jgi:hypothetical protein